MSTMTDADVKALLCRHAALREEQHALLTLHDSLRDRVDKLDDEVCDLSDKMIDINRQLVTDELVVKILQHVDSWRWSGFNPSLQGNLNCVSPVLGELRNIHHSLYKTPMGQSLSVRINVAEVTPEGVVKAVAHISRSNLNLVETATALKKLGLSAAALVVRNGELTRLQQEICKINEMFAFVDKDLESHDA